MPIKTRMVDTAHIVDEAVTTEKIAAEAVVAAKIAAGAIIAVKIGAGEVTTEKLDALAVTAIKIAADAITTAKIVAGAVTSDELGALAVIASKIAADAVETGKIADSAVIASKIAANAVIAAKIAAGAITTEKLDALVVTAEKIAAEAITAVKLSTGELITLTAQIKDAIITSAKISDLDVSKLTAGTLAAIEMILSNGGVFKSENYVVDTIGFSLDAINGLFINTGKIGGAAVDRYIYKTTEGATYYVKPKTGDTAFTGTGLDDCITTYESQYNGEDNCTYTVEIDGTGTPDTFKWRKNDGSWTEGVAITGGLQTLAENVKVKFGATTGHTVGDKWAIACQGSTSDNDASTAEKAFNTIQAVIDGLPGIISHYVVIRFENGLNYSEQVSIMGFIVGKGSIQLTSSSGDQNKVLVSYYQASGQNTLLMLKGIRSLNISRISFKVMTDSGLGTCIGAYVDSYVSIGFCGFSGSAGVEGETRGVVSDSSVVNASALGDYDVSSKCTYGLEARDMGLIDTTLTHFGTTYEKIIHGGLIVNKSGLPKIIDNDGDSYETVEKTSDSDEAVTYLKDVLVRKFHDSGILDLPKQSACRVYLGADQDIPKDTWTKVTLGSAVGYVNWDIQSEWTTATNRFIATKNGYYQVNVGVLLKEAQAAGDRLFIAIYVNNAEVARATFNHDAEAYVSAVVSDILSLSATDYVEMFVQHMYSENRLIFGGSPYTFMSIHKLA